MSLPLPQPPQPPRPRSHHRPTLPQTLHTLDLARIQLSIAKQRALQTDEVFFQRVAANNPLLDVTLPFVKVELDRQRRAMRRRRVRRVRRAEWFVGELVERVGVLRRMEGRKKKGGKEEKDLKKQGERKKERKGDGDGQEKEKGKEVEEAREDN